MTRSATSQKLSISLPGDQVAFVEAYRKDHDLSSRSEVISRGIEMLRQEALAAAYRQHAAEWHTDPDREFWDAAAISDGLDEETAEW